jgi:hypothetical protein
MDVEVLRVHSPVIASIDATEETMIQATGWVVIGQRFDRVQQRVGDPLNRARWRWALPVAVAVLALVPAAAQSDGLAVRDAAMQEAGDPPKTDGAKPSHPPRSLLRIGTDALLTDVDIREVAFSPDGRLIAAACFNPPSPEVEIFEVRTGRPVKRLAAPAVRLEQRW